jgi:hypothetical protein
MRKLWRWLTVDRCKEWQWHEDATYIDFINKKWRIRK